MKKTNASQIRFVGHDFAAMLGTITSHTVGTIVSVIYASGQIEQWVRIDRRRRSQGDGVYCVDALGRLWTSRRVTLYVPPQQMTDWEAWQAQRGK